MANASLSTHVLDTTTGRPAQGLRVELERDGVTIAAGTTDADGRIRDLAQGLEPGVYRIVFKTREHAADVFFTQVGLDVHLPEGHSHVPLLLSRFGVSAYRGS